MPKRKASTRRRKTYKAKSYKRRKTTKKTYKKKAAKRSRKSKSWASAAFNAADQLADFVPYGRAALGVGKAAYGAYKTYKGRGAYRSGGSVSFKNQGKMATFAPSGRGTMRVQHSEYLDDVISSTTVSAFVNGGGWLINPGNADTFPWLSTLALQFQEYEFVSLMFEFRSTSGVSTANASPALGVVIGATEYNVIRPDFSSKSEADNYEFVVSDRPDRSKLYPIECKPKMNVMERLFVDPSLAIPTISGQDPRFSWLGKFQIMASGVPVAAVNLGELWVTYDVILAKPALSSAIFGGQTAYGRFGAGTSTNPIDSPVISGVSNTVPFGSQIACIWPLSGTSATSALHGSSGDQNASSYNWVANWQNNLTDTTFASNSGQITFRKLRIGTPYRFSFTYTWSAAVSVPSMALNLTSGGNSFNDIGHFGYSAVTPYSTFDWPSGTTGTSGTCMRDFRATNTTVVLTLIVGANPATSLASIDAWITELPFSSYLAPAMSPDSKQSEMESVASQAYEAGVKSATRRFLRSRADRADRKGESESEQDEQGDWLMSESEPDEQELEELNLRQKRARQMQIGPKVSNLMAGLGLTSTPGNTPTSSRSPSRDRGDGKEEKKKT